MYNSFQYIIFFCKKHEYLQFFWFLPSLLFLVLGFPEWLIRMITGIVLLEIIASICNSDLVGCIVWMNKIGRVHLSWWILYLLFFVWCNVGGWMIDANKSETFLMFFMAENCLFSFIRKI